MELEPSSSSVAHIRTQRRGREEKGRENQSGERRSRGERSRQ